MKISVDIESIRKKFGYEKAIELIKEAGYDCVDFGYYDFSPEEREEILGENCTGWAKNIRKVLDKTGLECNQAHAPWTFKSGNVMDLSDEGFKLTVRSMESASILGARNIVIHAVVPPEGETEEDYNYKFYESLEPYAKKFGIKIAVENLFKGPYDEKIRKYKQRFQRPEDMNALIKRLDSDAFVVCVDVGHCGISDTQIEAQDYIRGLDKGIVKALHIHDNDYTNDFHQLPYLHKMNWEEICKALGETGYDGDFTYECMCFFNLFEDELTAPALKFSYEVAKHLVNKINKYSE